MKKRLLVGTVAWLLWVGVLVLAGYPLYAAANTNYLSYVTGEAYDADNGHLLYREHHLEKFINGEITYLHSIYTDRDDNVIAYRNLDYSEDRPWTPDYKFKDLRSGREESVTKNGQALEIRVREKKASQEKVKQLQLADDLVVDGGFDRFIWHNRAGLTNAEVLSFRFVIPAQLDAYKFKLSEIDRFVEQDGIFVDAELKISNWFIRMFVDSIQATYALEPFRIAKFNGVSNIRDAGGQLQNVTIVFQDPPSKKTFTPTEDTLSGFSNLQMFKESRK